jgi:hypothetical protein
MQLALLLHYDFDLAAVQRFLGGEHVAEHLLISTSSFRSLSAIIIINWDISPTLDS